MFAVDVVAVGVPLHVRIERGRLVDEVHGQELGVGEGGARQGDESGRGGERRRESETNGFFSSVGTSKGRVLCGRAAVGAGRAERRGRSKGCVRAGDLGVAESRELWTRGPRKAPRISAAIRSAPLAVAARERTRQRLERQRRARDVQARAEPAVGAQRQIPGFTQPGGDARPVHCAGAARGKPQLGEVVVLVGTPGGGFVDVGLEE